MLYHPSGATFSMASEDTTAPQTSTPETLPNRNDTSESDIEDSDQGDKQKVSHDRNVKLQQHFARKMRRFATMKRHRRVAVLLLSWKKQGRSSSYLNVQPEINDLRNVFEKQYHFRVHERQLETGSDEVGEPGDQLICHLAEFIRDEKKNGSLLIVYYAGHGIRNTNNQGLILLGANPKEEDRQKSLTRITWSNAEVLLHNTKADKLLIFDCCYAGILAQENRSFSKTIFEYIAATQADRTAVGPGAESFTRALIWALKQLTDQKDGFTTTTLMKKIMRAPKLRKDQIPICSERGKMQSINKLTLAPLSPEPVDTPRPSLDVSDQEPENLTQFHLHLTFSFSEWVQRKHVSYLCHNLCELGREIPLKQVLWKGLSEEDNRMSRIEDTVYKVLWKARGRSSSRKDAWLGIPVTKIGTESGEPSTPSTEAHFSDATLVETPIAIEVPQRLPKHFDEPSEHVCPGPIEPSSFMGGLRMLLIFLLAWFLGAHWSTWSESLTDAV